MRDFKLLASSEDKQAVPAVGINNGLDIGKKSRGLLDLIKDRPAMMKFPDNLPLQGGVPILHQGECVGAIGVSGVQSQQDEQVANAGISALS